MAHLTWHIKIPVKLVGSDPITDDAGETHFRYVGNVDSEWENNPDKLVPMAFTPHIQTQDGAGLRNLTEAEVAENPEEVEHVRRHLKIAACKYPHQNELLNMLT